MTTNYPVTGSDQSPDADPTATVGTTAPDAPDDADGDGSPADDVLVAADTEEAPISAQAAVVTDGAYALIVADFSDVDSAWEAYQELQEATKADRLDIEGALVVKKDAAGEITVQKATDYRTRRGLAWGLVGGVVIGVLFPPSILASAAVLGAAGAGIGRLRYRHNRQEVAEDLAESIDPGHSGLIMLVSDPAAVEIEKALTKANRIVQKAVDKAAAEDIKAEAADQASTSKDANDSVPEPADDVSGPDSDSLG